MCRRRHGVPRLCCARRAAFWHWLRLSAVRTQGFRISLSLSLSLFPHGAAEHAAAMIVRSATFRDSPRLIGPPTWLGARPSLSRAWRRCACRVACGPHNVGRPGPAAAPPFPGAGAAGEHTSVNEGWLDTRQRRESPTALPVCVLAAVMRSVQAALVSLKDSCPLFASADSGWQNGANHAEKGCGGSRWLITSLLMSLSIFSKPSCTVHGCPEEGKNPCFLKDSCLP